MRSNSSPSKSLAVPGGGRIPSSVLGCRSTSRDTPTLILMGALDAWTLAADCSNRLAAWGNDGPPIELVVYPGAHRGFYYPHFQPGRALFGRWAEYNEEVADHASLRLRQFLDRHSAQYLVDDAVGAVQKLAGHGQAERPCGLKIDDKLTTRDHLEGHVSRLGAF